VDKNKMQYIEALDEPNENDREIKIFLAGGIQNCPDWQKDVVQQMEDFDVILLNPRRKNFPIHDPNASMTQIDWERTWLDKADLVTFWFAKETIQPTTLFKLGRFVDRQSPVYKNSVPILIGIHPEYPKKHDVEIQTLLARSGFKFVYSLDEHVKQIKDYVIAHGICFSCKSLEGYTCKKEVLTFPRRRGCKFFESKHW
jgi:hypothetical protein